MIKLGITCGDINGIGLEVTLKALSNKLVLKKCTPVIYGSTKVVSYHKNIAKKDDISLFSINPGAQPKHGRVNVMNCWNDNVNITLGKVTEEGGRYALTSLEHVIKDLKNGDLDAMVTAPINKQAMRMAGFEYPGHTEFLADSFEADNYMMNMVDDSIKVALVTEHLPLADVAASVTKELVLKRIKQMNKSLKQDFGHQKPLIAVLGLNPHSGDGGVIGKEEENFIIPAVQEAKNSNINVMGPFGADGFFGSGAFKKFDGVLAMYHDQGLIPFKTITGQAGVNYTSGLPYVRTSPDHGTAFDLSGKNMADPISMRNAILLACDIQKHRTDFKNLHEGSLKKKQQVSEAG